MLMSKVLVENLYYDGPRGGITSIEGRHYRFVSDFNGDSGFTDEFSLYLISESELQLEIEQWQIFVKWNKKYQSGELKADSHPGHGGISKRWDEIEHALAINRKDTSNFKFKATATFTRNDQELQYDLNGPCYDVSWHFL